MNKTNAMAALAGATLLLVGCGSDRTGEHAESEATEGVAPSSMPGPVMKASNDVEFMESLYAITEWLEENGNPGTPDKFYLLARHVYFEQDGGAEKLSGARASEVLEMAPERWEAYVDERRAARQRRIDTIEEHNERVRKREQQEQERLEKLRSDPAS